MNGKDVISTLLIGFAPLVPLVPNESVAIDRLSGDVGLNNLLIRKISGVDYQPLAGEATTLVTQRVQVTVRARDGLTRDQIIALVKQACSNQTGEIAGLSGVAVLSAGEGPDFDDDDASIFMGSHDFMVSFNTAA